MGTKKSSLEESLQKSLDELETVTDEIKVKLHLAGMDANKTWDEVLEPKLLAARQHATEAKAAGKKAIDDAVAAFREFAATL